MAGFDDEDVFRGDATPGAVMVDWSLPRCSAASGHELGIAEGAIPSITLTISVTLWATVVLDWATEVCEEAAAENKRR